MGKIKNIYRAGKKVDSIESLEEYVKDMDTRHIQAGRGKLNVSISGVAAGNSFFNGCYFDNDVISEGAIPEGVFTVGILAQSKKPNILAGHPIRRGDVLLLNQGESIIHSIPAGSHFLALQIKHQDLNMLGVKTEKRFSRFYGKDENEYNPYFFRQILGIWQEVHNCKEDVLQNLDGNMIHNHILAETAYFMSQADQPEPINRHDYIKIAEGIREYLWSHSTDIIQVADLCRETGKSERTLERICKYAFGKPPRELIKLHRLHALRHALIARGPQSPESIMMLAMRFGFTNSGRMAKAYQMIFGELPSETLSITPQRAQNVKLYH